MGRGMLRGPIRLGRLEILSWAQWVDLSPFCPGVSRDLQGALGGGRPRNREQSLLCRNALAGASRGGRRYRILVEVCCI